MRRSTTTETRRAIRTAGKLGRRSLVRAFVNTRVSDCELENCTNGRYVFSGFRARRRSVPLVPLAGDVFGRSARKRDETIKTARRTSHELVGRHSPRRTKTKKIVSERRSDRRSVGNEENVFRNNEAVKRTRYDFGQPNSDLKYSN